MVQRNDAGDCDLMVTTGTDGVPRGELYRHGAVTPDRTAEASRLVGLHWDLASTEGSEQVWTCVPPGSGERMAIDRDEDGARDGDERAAGTNPGDPLDRPGGAVLAVAETGKVAMEETAGTTRAFVFKSRASDSLVAPPPGSKGDPTVSGATLHLYDASGSGEHVTVALPATGWERAAGGYRYCGDDAMPCVNVRPHSFSAEVAGAGLGYTLDERRQGRLAVRLVFGDAVQRCAETLARVDESGRYRSAEPTGTVAPCPAVPSVSEASVPGASAPAPAQSS